MSLFSLLSIVTVILQLFHLHYYGKGNTRVAYRFGVFVYVFFLIVETILAFGPGQWSIMLFNIVNLWGFYNAVQGAIREKSFSFLNKQ